MTTVNIKGVKPSWGERFISTFSTVLLLEMIIMLVLGLIYWWDVPNSVFLPTFTVFFLLGTIIGWKADQTKDATLDIGQNDIKYSSNNTEQVILLTDIKSIHIERRTTGYANCQSNIYFQLLDKDNYCLLSVDQWHSNTNVFTYAEYLSALTDAKITKQFIFNNDSGEPFFHINFDHINQPENNNITDYDVVVFPTQEMVVTCESDKSDHWLLCFFLVASIFFLIYGYLVFALSTFFIVACLSFIELLSPSLQQITLTKSRITYAYSMAFLNRKKLIMPLKQFRVVSTPHRYGVTYHIFVQSKEGWHNLVKTSDIETALNLTKKIANHMDLPIEVDARIAHKTFA
ncbi:hypothetical protein [Zooshikella sp. RANM57]|uniref:hypothetical protein n=1 Tax=Zooshikella sp. RANM57 TaxID=3425863 RepID=UPI003D6F669F